MVDNKIKVACVGDSITFGLGDPVEIEPDGSYPN
jgi:lysophospholipase L1-like esterase